MKNTFSVLTAILLLVLLGAIQSCTYDEYPPEEEPVIEDLLSFEEEIIPIFNQSCNNAGCHTTGAVSPDLSPGNAYRSLIDGGYIDVTVPENSELLIWMRGNGDLDMPLDGPNVEYNAKVLAWITQGALNN